MCVCVEWSSSTHHAGAHVRAVGLLGLLFAAGTWVLVELPPLILTSPNVSCCIIHIMNSTVDLRQFKANIWLRVDGPLFYA